MTSNEQYIGKNIGQLKDINTSNTSNNSNTSNIITNNIKLDTTKGENNSKNEDNHDTD